MFPGAAPCDIKVVAGARLPEANLSGLDIRAASGSLISALQAPVLLWARHCCLGSAGGCEPTCSLLRMGGTESALQQGQATSLASEPSENM